LPITFHRIEKIKLKLSNAYLILGRKPVLVDTGSPGEAHRIVEALELHDLAPEDLSLILITHAHADHAGSVAALKRRAPHVPVAIHADDTPLLVSGKPEALQPTCTFGRVLKRFVSEPFEGLEPDVVLHDGFDLAPYGLCGNVLHTPGHTVGSSSIVLQSGEALIGDVLMGGMMGGNLFPTKPRLHYFATDCQANQLSLQRIMAYNPNRVFVGHGGPLDAQRVLDWMQCQGIALLQPNVTDNNAVPLAAELGQKVAVTVRTPLQP